MSEFDFYIFWHAGLFGVLFLVGIGAGQIIAGHHYRRQESMDATVMAVVQKSHGILMVGIPLGFFIGITGYASLEYTFPFLCPIPVPMYVMLAVILVSGSSVIGFSRAKKKILNQNHFSGEEC